MGPDVGWCRCCAPHWGWMGGRGREGTRTGATMALCPLTAGCSSLRSSVLSLPQCPRDARSFRQPLSPWCCGCATHLLCGATVGSPGQ